jgi:hypothetical protein
MRCARAPIRFCGRIRCTPLPQPAATVQVHACKSSQEKRPTVVGTAGRGEVSGSLTSDCETMSHRFVGSRLRPHFCGLDRQPQDRQETPREPGVSAQLLKHSGFSYHFALRREPDVEVASLRTTFRNPDRVRAFTNSLAAFDLLRSELKLVRHLAHRLQRLAVRDVSFHSL